jgi:putative DNA modification/repair radical SAM protein
MKTAEKLVILANSAKYDAACVSSGSSRQGVKEGLGNTHASGICHSWSADGRCISLLKILLSNDCRYDCVYCASRRTNSIERATFTAEEVVDLTINFYCRNYIEGLFLSSAVHASPDATMAEMVEACRLLRERERFNGYIHLKIIPGASAELVDQAGRLADRLSVNIELPSARSLQQLAPQKSKPAILRPMQQIGEAYSEYRLERRKTVRGPSYCPAGQATQMIVGASPESDLQILTLSERLYQQMHLRRVYYSAYMGVNEDPLLPALALTPPLLREHRLYQADWLMRFYHFSSGEIVSADFPHLSERFDPKAAWALRNFDFFPLDVVSASYEELLRVPGIGPVSARRIVQTRRSSYLRAEDLQKMGLVFKRAKYFISIGGKSLVGQSFSHHEVRRAMEKAEPKQIQKLQANGRQLRLF